MTDNLNMPVPNRRTILWLRDGRICYWCGLTTRLINPRYKGGSNDYSNLVSACALCNNRRCYEDHKGTAERLHTGPIPVPEKTQRASVRL